MVGLLIPLVFQIVYLLIAIPAVKDGSNGMKNLKITIVNEDQNLGKSVSAKLGEVLPFKTETTADLPVALDNMNNGDCSMVIHIASDFTAQCQQGSGQVSYYINQSAPSMTKQAMERTAVSINQTLNENAFNSVKEILKQNSSAALGQAGLPAAAATAISVNLNKAFDSLKYTNISSDIQKVNNADGFAQTVLPFFVFLTFFVGCIIMTILHTLAYKPLYKEVSRVRILLSQLGVNILISLVIPCVVIGLAACFAIPFSLGTGAAWLILSVGFFTLLYMVQMFANWFSIPGMGLAVLLLFPLQLVTSGLIYSREILPAFYTAVSPYLPSTYLGDSMLKMFYGGPSVSKDIWILFLMSAVFIVVSALTLFKKNRKAAAVN